MIQKKWPLIICVSYISYLTFLGLMPYLLNKDVVLDDSYGPFSTNILWCHMDSR